MKTKKYFNILKELAEKIGDPDLTVSMAYSNKEFFVSVSTHASDKYEFTHGGYQRTVQITKKDFDTKKENIVTELINIYRRLLVPKKEGPRNVVK